MDKQKFAKLFYFTHPSRDVVLQFLLTFEFEAEKENPYVVTAWTQNEVGTMSQSELRFSTKERAENCFDVYFTGVELLEFFRDQIAVTDKVTIKDGVVDDGEPKISSVSLTLI